MANQPINENLLWDQVSADVRSKFRHRQASKVLLRTGYELFKFSEWGLVKPDGTVSPWWISVIPHWPGEIGLDLLIQRAVGIKVSPADYTRAVAAVNRNRMTSLLRARLREPAYAFVGQCSGQPFDPDCPALANVTLIGGVVQLYIPNLVAAHVGKV